MEARPLVLITGVSGFLGSYLARTFLGLGWRVAGLSRRSSGLNRLEDLRSAIRLFDWGGTPFDGGEPLRLRDSVVIHTATDYGRAGSDTDEIAAANVARPLELLRRSLNEGSRCFINTDTFYPPERDLYARSKREFLDAARVAVNGAPLAFVNLRVHHMYGPGDGMTKFIPWVIRQCLANAPLNLTSGEQERHFIFISDVLEAFRLTAEGIGVGAVSMHDVATDERYTLRALVELIRELTCSKSVCSFGVVPHLPGEIFLPVVESGGLKQLGWYPRVSLRVGLEQTIAWERNHRSSSG